MTTHFNMKKKIIPILPKFYDIYIVVNKVSEHSYFHFGRFYVVPK